MAWTFLQSNSAGLDPGAAAVTYLNNVVSGSKLIAYICTAGGGNPQVTAIKDAALNAMTKVGSAFLNNAAGSGELTIWAMDTPAGDVGTKPTLTATQTGGNQSFGMVIQEVSGLLAGNTTAMIDGTAVGSTGSISANGPIACGAYSTAVAGEYLVAVGGDLENSTLTWAAPTGSTTYTRDAHARNATVILNCVPSFGLSTGGAETASSAITGAGTATPWATLFVAFKLDEGGGGSGVAQSREHLQRHQSRLHRVNHRQQQSSFADATIPVTQLPVILTTPSTATQDGSVW